MTTYTIHVLQEDINDGEREKCKRCPIALAIQRTLDTKFADVFPHVAYTRKTNGTFWSTAALPDIATAFIFRFDAGQPVEPFSFEVTFRGLDD
jgi:hypothetical protein